MKGLLELGQALAEYLREQGVEAVTAWTPERRLRPGKAVVAVSLRKLESGPPGFQNYLGERYNQETEQWEELYGKKVELTFGLDVYAATAQEVQAGLEVLGTALEQRGAAGMAPVELSAGETEYQSESRRYVCPVQARFSAWATAVSRGEGEFLDFEVRGESEG